MPWQHSRLKERDPFAAALSGGHQMEAGQALCAVQAEKASEAAAPDLKATAAGLKQKMQKGMGLQGMCLIAGAQSNLHAGPMPQPLSVGK